MINGWFIRAYRAFISVTNVQPVGETRKAVRDNVNWPLYCANTASRVYRIYGLMFKCLFYMTNADTDTV